MLGCLLAAVGGYLDAFTYLWRGVFANSQTGNVVLMAISISRGDWHGLVVRIPAMVAFLLGVLAAQFLATHRVRRVLRRPARWVLAVEMGTLVFLGAAPDHASRLAVTTTVSFIAALQVVTFRKVERHPYTSTMVTGNLRTMTASAFAGVVDGDPTQLERAGVLALVVTAFAFGAAAGGFATIRWQAHAAWVVAGMLALALAMLVHDSRVKERDDEEDDEDAPGD